jgi:DNA invertase Pin-like site-specific DNA recombinase
MFQMMGVFAEFERATIAERVKGCSHAGTEPGKAARASPGEHRCGRAYPQPLGERGRNPQNSQSTRRRHGNSSQGKTRDGGL